MKAGRIIALLMGLTLMALLLPMQATAAGAAPGIVMGGGAVTKGNTIVMAGTEWDVVLNTTNTNSASGRLLITSAQKKLPSDSSTTYWDEMGYINTFYANSFADLEKAAVMSTSKTDPEGNYAGIRFADSRLSGAKLFALSASEATLYFGSDTERLPGGWWLRSLHNDMDYEAGVVHVDGFVGLDTFNHGYGVRPAFNLNLSSSHQPPKAANPSPP